MSTIKPRKVYLRDEDLDRLEQLALETNSRPKDGSHAPCWRAMLRRLIDGELVLVESEPYKPELRAKLDQAIKQLKEAPQPPPALPQHDSQRRYRQLLMFARRDDPSSDPDSAGKASKLSILDTETA